MKTLNSKSAIIFVRTDEQTKQEFLDNVKRACMKQTLVVEMLIKNWNNKMRTQSEKNAQ